MKKSIIRRIEDQVGVSTPGPEVTLLLECKDRFEQIDLLLVQIKLDAKQAADAANWELYGNLKVICDTLEGTRVIL